MICNQCRSKIPEGSSFCGYCGQHLLSSPVSVVPTIASASNYDAPLPAPQKKNKKKTFIAVGAFLLAVAVMIACYYLFRSAELVMDVDGKLYVEGYNGPLNDSPVEFPRKYDRRASGFADGIPPYSEYQYNGTVREFANNYKWVLVSDYSSFWSSTIFVHCDDYTLEIATKKNSNGISIDYEPEAHIVKRNYVLYASGDEEIKAFEYASDLINWLN